MTEDAILYDCGHMIKQKNLDDSKSYLFSVQSGLCPKCVSGETKPDPERYAFWISMLAIGNAVEEMGGAIFLESERKYHNLLKKVYLGVPCCWG